MMMAVPLSHVPGEQYRPGNWLFDTALFDVYRGTDQRLDRDVHLRLLKPRLTREPAVADALIAGAKEAAALVHPNLVTVYDVGTFGGRRGLVTEATARKLAGADLTAEQLRRVAGDYLAGLDAAHTAGLLHGGIDVGSLFLAADDTGKLADVGLASPATVDGDLRALAAALLKQSDGRDAAFEDALRRALSADPAVRYVSATAMLEALAELPAHETTQPAIPTRPAPEQAAPKRARPVLSTNGVWAAARSLAWLAVVVIMVAALLAFAWNDTDSPTPGRPSTQVQHVDDLPPEIPR